MIAAVIVEPIAGNMGVVEPAPGFLEGLRALCDAHGALLVFDEVITGFRAGWSGAQGRFGVLPDLTTLGKVIGGGLPVGAYGGPRALLERMAPVGDVYQAGTLSGNPLAMAAGLATLRALRDDESAYARLDELGARLAAGIEEAASGRGRAAGGGPQRLGPHGVLPGEAATRLRRGYGERHRPLRALPPRAPRAGGDVAALSV